MTVTGNTFCNSEIGGATKRPKEHAQPISRDLAYGVLLDGTSDIVLTGNVFSSLRNSAVTTTGNCMRILLVGNAFADVATEHDNHRALTGDITHRIESANSRAGRTE
jgi:hypothetical protein